MYCSCTFEVTIVALSTPPYVSRSFHSSFFNRRTCSTHLSLFRLSLFVEVYVFGIVVRRVCVCGWVHRSIYWHIIVRSHCIQTSFYFIPDHDYILHLHHTLLAQPATYTYLLHYSVFLFLFHIPFFFYLQIVHML